mgnify:CR=1 FL=1
MIQNIKQHIDNKAKEGIEISSIVTFDDYGVSGHPNHISTHHGCMQYYQQAKGQVDMFTLDSVWMFRKYDAFLDIFTANNSKINFFLPSPYQAVSALIIHHTQFVWYRKLFMAFSRYGYFNSLTYHPAKPLI